MNVLVPFGNLKSTRARWAVIVGAAILFGGAAFAQHAPKATPAPQKLTENDRIVHVLNRMGFGARPEDIDKIRKMGLEAYVDQQLSPDQIDDSALELKLKTFKELQLPDTDIEAKYADFVTSDQDLAKLRRQAAKLAAQKTSPGDASTTTTSTGTNQAVQAQQAMRDMAMQNPDAMQQVQQTRLQLATTAEPIALLHEEFDADKLLRAVESQRQFQEVMVDFWSNHFNIDTRKAPCGVLKILDDRDVIRPHIFGRFRDLLEASAKSPAMLVYLDNFQSFAANPQMVRRGGRLVAQPLRRKVGLNENYAREIMELHTLGVDGGYTQQDVREVARCLTGWSIGETDGSPLKPNRYGQAGVFRFYPALHDSGQKVVLGVTIPAGGGMSDGETVLDILCTSPATMKHVSYQLCQRLVSDDPPASLIQKCVDTWKRTDGNLREVYHTIVTSPEFYAPDAMRHKIKSPFEYGVSCVRALGGTLDPEQLVSRRQLPREANGLIRPPQGGGYIDINTDTLLGQIGTMGQPIFQYQAPTGFPEDSRKWVSSGALISRLNFSLALTSGKIKDVSTEDLSEDAGGMDSGKEIDRLADRILHGEISASTRATLLSEAKGADGLTRTTIAALLLGSPEFQRR